MYVVSFMKNDVAILNETSTSRDFMGNLMPLAIQLSNAIKEEFTLEVLDKLSDKYSEAYPLYVLYDFPESIQEAIDTNNLDDLYDNDQQYIYVEAEDECIVMNSNVSYSGNNYKLKFILRSDM